MQTGENYVWFQGKCFDCNEKFLRAKLAHWGFVYNSAGHYMIYIRLEADKNRVEVKVGISSGTDVYKKLVTKYYACAVEEMVDQWVKV